MEYESLALNGQPMNGKWSERAVKQSAQLDKGNI